MEGRASTAYVLSDAALPIPTIPLFGQELRPAAQQCGLADFDQMAIGVASAPLRVHGLDVRDHDVQEAARAVRVGRCLSVTVGLSSVGPPPTLMMIQLLASAT